MGWEFLTGGFLIAILSAGMHFAIGLTTQLRRERKGFWSGDLWIVWKDGKEDRFYPPTGWTGSTERYGNANVDMSRPLAGFLLRGVEAGKIPFIEIDHYDQKKWSCRIPFSVQENRDGILIVPFGLNWSGEGDCLKETRIRIHACDFDLAGKPVSKQMYFEVRHRAPKKLPVGVSV